MSEDTEISPDLREALNSLSINRVTLSINEVWCGLIVNNAWILSQALLSNNMETICIYLNAQPCKMETMHGLPIKSLSLFGREESLNINHVSSLYKLISSLKQLEKLSFIINNDSAGLWGALCGLNIKSLSLNDGYWYNVLPLCAQFLSSLTQLETFNIKVTGDTHIGLFDALHGLNVKTLRLSGLRGGLEFEKMLEDQQMKRLPGLFQSITLLDTLSIGVKDDCSGLSEILRGLNIKSLSLSGCRGSLEVHHAELLSQSISSLTQLETLTLSVFAYIELKLPQSLKYFNFNCTRISPQELRDLVKALSACTQTAESKLEFGCARFTYYNEFASRESPQILSKEYSPIERELTEQKNVTVKRFRILDRIHVYRNWYDSAEFAWLVRYDMAVEKDDTDDGILDNETYNSFIRHLDSCIDNRISMRLQSHAASNSCIHTSVRHDCIKT